MPFYCKKHVNQITDRFASWTLTTSNESDEVEAEA